MIDGEIKGGILDKEMRARKIIIHIDKSESTNASDIPTEDTIYLFLVDCASNILWRDVGTFSEEKENAVLKAISDF
ncbi:MAG: hypothetical protein ACFFCF_07500 [Promethearchaeota archaeon]